MELMVLESRLEKWGWFLPLRFHKQFVQSDKCMALQKKIFFPLSITLGEGSAPEQSPSRASKSQCPETAMPHRWKPARWSAEECEAKNVATPTIYQGQYKPKTY